MRTLALLTVWLVAACRFNFTAQPDAPPEPSVDAPVVRVIPCDAPPPRFPVNGTITQLIATATERGYHVFTVDDTGAIHGYTYEFQDQQMVATVVDASIPAAVSTNGTIGVASLTPSASDSVDVMLAVTYGEPYPTGTALLPLDAKLRPAGPAVMHDNWVGGYGSLAPADNGVVFLAVDASTNKLHAMPISRSGTAPGPATHVDTAGLGLTEPTIMRAGTKYLVVWGASDAGPPALNQAKAAVLDANLGIVAYATTVSDPTKKAQGPKAAYSEASKSFLFAWFVKTSTDNLGFSLRDEQLAEIQAPVTAMAPQGFGPRLVAGTDDFLIAWTGAGDTDLLGAARVRWDGSAIYPGISSSGPTGRSYALASDVVTRAGQPALIWLEKDSNGPNLWIDPLCR